ncbi:MAG: ribosomal protein S18-alanine N-acetyltransferase [Candidatus Avoscillospira sp.]
MMQNEIELVPMTEAHVAAVAALEQVCFSDPWSEQSVRSELNNPLSLWLTALDGDTVAGYVGSQTVLDEADIMNVAVAPEYRRRGIARQLLDRLRDLLAAQGVRSLTLEVRASNGPAIALYESLGYVQVGRRPNYYFKPREDALILRKEWSL